MNRGLHALAAFVFTTFAVTGFANSFRGYEKVAFCMGNLNNGERVEVSIFQRPDNKHLLGTILRNDQGAKTTGLALELQKIEYTPDTRANMIEYHLQSDQTYAADTGSFYTMFIYADQITNEVRGKQFINIYRKGRTPRFGTIECAGTFPN